MRGNPLGSLSSQRSALLLSFPLLGLIKVAAPGNVGGVETKPWPVEAGQPCQACDCVSSDRVLEDRLSCLWLEKVEPARIQVQPEPVARFHLELGIDPRRDRRVADHAVDELVGTEDLRDLDLHV